MDNISYEVQDKWASILLAYLPYLEHCPYIRASHDILDIVELVMLINAAVGVIF